MVIVLLAFCVAILGTVGLTQRLADWLAALRAIRIFRSGPIPTIVASLILAAPIVIPKFGLLVLMPILFTICGGVGVATLWMLAHKESPRQETHGAVYR